MTVLLRIWLSDVELGTVVIVLLKVWLSDVELGRFDYSQLGTLVMVFLRV